MPPGWQPNSPVFEGGVPWESASSGLFGRWWATLAATFKGRPFFAAVSQSDDAMSAVTFHTLTMAMMGLLTGALIFLVFAVMGSAASSLFGPLLGRGTSFTMAGGAILSGFFIWVAAIVAAGFFGFTAPWLLGGIHHLVLALLGAVPPGRSYASTVRAHAYANAGAMVFTVIPYLGGLVAMVLGIKNHLEAYDETHRCGAGKAFLAYVSPVVCSCCGCGLFGTFIGSLGTLFHP